MTQNPSFGMKPGHKPRKDCSPEPSNSSESSYETIEEPPTKVYKKDSWTRDCDGYPFFELSKTRRVTVRKFSGKMLVDIREYYNNGETLAPGRKGISLSIEQYEKLKSYLADIDDAIQRGVP
ncbi:Activated RNA polymerase II transcriptional coactivator p15 [Galdieria sulphuraria]|uniref:KIWI n=1 Tax=Galdieria sulphuraria TaxID=130081 RepID=M2XW77_GALSU|nr:KIWI [Galdieria sulphuraria]EME27694.1 KIWI [Galdieria sulphuraria]GJD07410.1 Activated RNA polymerase II transcriptional coactivator p15 [Galdieria sulphuraria]|eukprot:XP_005704214.1 KIWI [Galdieria sulphuraria]